MSDISIDGEKGQIVLRLDLDDAEWLLGLLGYLPGNDEATEELDRAADRLGAMIATKEEADWYDELNRGYAQDRR